MKKNIKVKVVTMERIAYENTVESVSVPTKAGRIGILPNHQPLIGLLDAGVLSIRHGGVEKLIAITSGFFEVRPDSEVVILADTADNVEDLNVGEIEKAKERVETMLKEDKQLSNIEFAHLEDVLGREISRLHIAHKYRGRKSL